MVGFKPATPKDRHHTDIPILATTVKVGETAWDLGVVIDSQISLAAHFSALCRSCCYQLRQLHPVVGSLSVDASKALVHAFISSRLDYCNSLLYGIANSLLQRLQSIQNAAARLITRARWQDHDAGVTSLQLAIPDNASSSRSPALCFNRCPTRHRNT